MRLDTTVKCIEVVEKCIFRSNGLTFGLCSTLMIVMIVHTSDCCCTIVYAPSSGSSNAESFSCSVKQIRNAYIAVTSSIFGRVRARAQLLWRWLLAKILLDSIDLGTLYSSAARHGSAAVIEFRFFNRIEKKEKNMTNL